MEGLRAKLRKCLKRTKAVVPLQLSMGFEEIKPECISRELNSSWQDPAVPQKQYEECTKSELRNYANGLPVVPFDALVNILADNIPNIACAEILEVGCSSGYYSEVLKIKGIHARYCGCDYSGAFIQFAKTLFPGVDFQVQDARSLSYQDTSFDIVISGCCLLHILEYEQAIAEAARVSRQYVVFHRTPVFHKKETTYYLKTAYGVKMFEIHFNERELFKLMHKYGLGVIDVITYHPGLDTKYGEFSGYKTYLCRKI